MCQVPAYGIYSVSVTSAKTINQLFNHSINQYYFNLNQASLLYKRSIFKVILIDEKAFL